MWNPEENLEIEMKRIIKRNVTKLVIKMLLIVARSVYDHNWEGDSDDENDDDHDTESESPRPSDDHQDGLHYCPPPLIDSSDDGTWWLDGNGKKHSRRGRWTSVKRSAFSRKLAKHGAVSRRKSELLCKRRPFRKNYCPQEAKNRMLYLHAVGPVPCEDQTKDEDFLYNGWVRKDDDEPAGKLMTSQDAELDGVDVTDRRIIDEILSADPYHVVTSGESRSYKCCDENDETDDDNDSSYYERPFVSEPISVVGGVRSDGRRETTDSLPTYVQSDIPRTDDLQIAENSDNEQSDTEQTDNGQTDIKEDGEIPDTAETCDDTTPSTGQCDVPTHEDVNVPETEKKLVEPPEPVGSRDDGTNEMPGIWSSSGNLAPMSSVEKNVTQVSCPDSDTDGVPTAAFEHSTVERGVAEEARKEDAWPAETGTTYTEDPGKSNTSPMIKSREALGGVASAGPMHEATTSASLSLPQAEHVVRRELRSEPDYRREKDRLASFHQAPHNAKFVAVICARLGLWYTGWKDCAACFFCPFRHWDWRTDQDPQKLHIENSPNCPVAQGNWPEDERYEPQMQNLSDAGKAKVSDRLRSLLPKQMALEEMTEDAKRRFDEEKKLLNRHKLEDSVAVHYRLSEAPLGEPRLADTTSDEGAASLPDHVPGGPTKIIYYALEHSRDGRQPRCVPHIVDPKATVAQKSGVPDELRSERKRIDSYKKWQNPPFSVYDYARNGFFYTENNRDIKCAFCGGVLAVPNVLRRFSITAKHKRAFPTCPLVLKLEVGNVPLPVDETIGLPKENTESPVKPVADPIGLEPIVTIKFPQFSDRQSRILSFMSWSTEYHQKSDALVESGFFCLGDGDAVRCFHCGGGLRNWEPMDEPWREHARWFPRCGYLQQKKGYEFVQRVQAESDVTNWVPSVAGPSSMSSNVEPTPSRAGKPRKLNLTRGGIPTPPPTTPRFLNGVTEPSVMSKGVQWRFQPREIRARMDTPGVRRLMEMGYSPVLIRFCIVTQLRDTGKDFSQLDELVEAVLDLEPVVEEHGEHFLEVILKNKYDLDHLPVLLKESYYKIVDKTFIPTTTVTRTEVTTTSSNGSGNAPQSAAAPISAPQTPATTTTTASTEARQAQTNRLESSVARVSNQASSGPSSGSQDAASGGDTESQTQGRRGRKSRGKKAGDSSSTETAAATGVSASASTAEASSSSQAASQLAEENKEVNLCKICMDRQINTILMPCGHVVVCSECGRTLAECPICRKSIKKRQRAFLS